MVTFYYYFCYLGTDSQHWYYDGFVWRGEGPRALPEYPEFNVRSVHLLLTEGSKISSFAQDASGCLNKMRQIPIFLIIELNNRNLCT